MRVTFLLPTYVQAPSGGFLVVYTLANRLVDRGHHVVVVHPTQPKYGPRLGSRIQARRWTRRRLNALRGLGPAPWFSIDPRVRMRYVPTLSPRWLPDGDVVVATAWSTAYAAGSAPARCGVGHYLIQSDESLWDPNVDLARDTWTLPLRQAVIAQWLVEVGQERGSRDLVHIPLAIDHTTFHLRRPVDARAPHIAMLASTNSVKRTSLGIELIESARLAVPDLRVSMFGSLPPDQKLPRWVDFVGVRSQTELGALFNETSTYLCTSRVEGWHLPPAEAMACGNALVSSDIGGVRDYARHGDTAWLAPVDDSDALLAGLVRVLTDEGLRTGLANRGMREIAGYTWHRTAAQFEQWLAGG